MNIDENAIKWPLLGFAPGNYICQCTSCKKQFMGDKLAVQCLYCAIENTRKTAIATSELHFSYRELQKKIDESQKLITRIQELLKFDNDDS